MSGESAWDRYLETCRTAHGMVEVTFKLSREHLPMKTDHHRRGLGGPALVGRSGRARDPPVDLDVPGQADLAISIYLPQGSGPATQYPGSRKTTYLFAPGSGPWRRWSGVERQKLVAPPLRVR
jgi:hypothetical protein